MTTEIKNKIQELKGLTESKKQNHVQEEWFRALYALANTKELSINELYEAFKKEISHKTNNAKGKPTLYFYSSDWTWGKELEGSYYKSIEADIYINDLLKCLEVAVNTARLAHDHNDPNVEYGNCEACLALSEIKNILEKK